MSEDFKRDMEITRAEMKRKKWRKRKRRKIEVEKKKWFKRSIQEDYERRHLWLLLDVEQVRSTEKHRRLRYNLLTGRDN